ncbi:MAG: hypothetical protein K6A30_04005 [Lachnospiraceae bacterium]|nr:hypothetical protein [Lachnospiraceae bacterium]
MKKSKWLAILVAIIMLAGIIGSLCFIIEYAHHDCCGEDCAICMEIEQAAQLISSLKIIPVLMVLPVILCAIAQIKKSVEECFISYDTLISLKVELLD